MNLRQLFPPLACAAVMFAALPSHASGLDRTVKFQIASQPLETALIAFSKQANIQVVIAAQSVGDTRAQALDATVPIRTALDTLLKNTGFRFMVIGDTVSVVPVSDAQADADVASTLRLAQTDAGTGPVSTREAERTAASATTDEATQRSEGKKSSADMTVTGTQIRGMAPVGSQVLTYTREDFERAGASTAQQFLSTLTQNFGGEYTDDALTVPAATGTPPDASYGRGINLRGLGTSSTLVLVNGRRLAASGPANYTDISVIPLSAVERIEVLTDSASATYGSDAIGGVVNIIMRSDYEAAQTLVKGGMSGHHDAKEIQVAQSLGTGWNSGSALINYEYHHRGAVNALDRGFARGAGGPYDLVGEDEKNAAWLSVQQQLSERVKLSTDALYSERQTDYQAWDAVFLNPLYITARSTQASASLGLEMKLGSAFTLSVQGDASRTKSHDEMIGSSDSTSVNNERALTASISGIPFELPSGPVRFAFGSTYKTEDFRYAFFTTTLPKRDFNSYAVFTEVVVPIIPASDHGERPRLLFSAAGRYEDYSNFGDTVDPKLGIEWTATDFLRMRASWGTSFKAPSLFQLNEYNAVYQINNAAIINPAGGTLLLVGNNASLQQETASSWNLGMDIHPSALPGFKAQLSYFDIEYKGRISAPSTTPVNTLLSRLRAAGAGFLRGDIPNDDFNRRVSEFFAKRVTWFGCTPIDPSTGACLAPVTAINAIADLRLTNLAQTHDRGLDVNLTQHFDSGLGSVDIGLNATYLLDFEQRLTSGSPIDDLLDTPYRPLDFRGRGSVGWSRGSWSLTGFVNYSDAYRNNLTVPGSRISSWTTADLNVQYRGQAGWLRDSTLTFNVQNLLDARPPTFVNPTLVFTQARVGYDQANADPIGRLFSLSIVKQW